MKTKKGKFLLIILSVEILLFLLLGVRMAVGMNLFICFSLLGSLIKTYPLLLLRMKMQNKGEPVVKKQNSPQPKIVEADNSANINFEGEMLYDELFR